MTLTRFIPIGVALACLGACNHEAPDNSSTVNVADAGNGSVGSSGAATTAGSAGRVRGSAGRVRGSVQAVTADALAVQTYDGRSVSVPIDAQTGYAWVARANLSDVKDNDFIGTATTGPDNALRAVEVVIFPESMRGTGEGHYGWDTPGVVAATGGGAGASSAMTNGTVQQQSAMTNGTVQGQSAMTNGTVSGTTGGSGDKTLTVTYKGGKSQIVVPAGTPVVRFEPAQKSILAAGQKVFVVTPPDAKAAKFVAVGKDGITPPM